MGRQKDRQTHFNLPLEHSTCISYLLFESHLNSQCFLSSPLNIKILVISQLRAELHCTFNQEEQATQLHVPSAVIVNELGLRFIITVLIGCQGVK